MRALWGRKDFLLLLAALLLALSGLGLFWLADEVAEAETQALDERLLLALRNPRDNTDPLGPPWVEEVGRDLTALGGNAVLTLVTGFVCGFLLMRGKRRALLLVLASFGGALALNLLAKTWFARPRPDLVPHLSHTLTSSFPSGHSTLAAAVYLTLGALLTRLVSGWRTRLYLLACALLLAVLVGVSRVYLGVHYPTDVVAGWALGLCWAVVCWLVARALQRRGAVEAPTPGPEKEPPGDGGR